MHTTRISFLARLVDGDPQTWRDFDAAYKPLLRHWLKNKGLSATDIEDLIQDILLFVSQRLAGFEHNTRTGAFRKWLRSSTVNLARNYARKLQRSDGGLTDLHDLLDELEDPNSRLSRAFEQDYQQALLQQLLRRSATAFTSETMSIFRQYVLEGETVDKTAANHKVSKAAVYIAKSRVLKHLREEWSEQFEEVK